MTECMLKSIFSLDTESHTYKPLGHNLSADEAAERLAKDPKANLVPQESRHRNPAPLKCRACKAAAQELTTKYAETSHGSEQNEEEGATQESESD